MTHSIDSYLPWSKEGRAALGDGTHSYYWSDSWSTAASATTTLISICVVSTLAFGIFSDEEALGWADWPWQLTSLLAFVTVVVHFLMCRAYDANSLTAAGNWAFRKFLEMPEEVQVELGGRDAFLARLKTFTPGDTKKVIEAMKQAERTRQDREKLEAQLLSHPEDFMEALDRYTGDQNEYINTLKELA